ncbi:hypothetical protein BGZ59_001989 [Podila verticillata]|nr:hypothetical protein BGZ59_001989 [Podila verticillata]
MNEDEIPSGHCRLLLSPPLPFDKAMKIVSLTTLTATSLVSAGKFISLSEKSTSVVQGAYIIDEDGIDDTKAGNSLDSHNVDYKISREFYVFNGASCDVRSGHNSEDLAMIPGVKRV